MNYVSPETRSPLANAFAAESRHPLGAALLNRIERLKDRLDNFTVVDAKGETVGEIRNLVLYKRRLHLVIVQPDVHSHWRFLLLSSPLVQQVSLRDRTLSVHTTHIDSTYLPEQRSVTKRATISAHRSVIAPVNQLPASQTHVNITAPRVIESPAMPKVLADGADASVERSPKFNQESNGAHPALSYPAATPVKPVTVRVSERGA